MMWKLIVVLAAQVLEIGGREVPAPFPLLPRQNGTSYKVMSKGTNTKASMADLARMPGTNWCGAGFRADSFASLGSYSGTDRCCRQHDLGCPEMIGPGEVKYGLKNFRFHAVMHCTCDERFRSCLAMAHTRTADIVGNTFFNVIQVPCFVFTRQRVCTKRTWWGRCLNTLKEKRAVWRKSIPYTKLF